MNYFGKIISNISQAYSEINPATLTGAIDVIVVEQEDGTYQTSPFHVRFGKMGVLRSREKIVDIEINGQPVDIHMKLGDGGEAYFLEECDDDDNDDTEEEVEEEANHSPIVVQSKNDSNVDSQELASLNSTSIAADDVDQPAKQPKDVSPIAKSDSCDDKTGHSITKTNNSGISASTPGSQKRTKRKRKCKPGHGRQMSNVETTATISFIDAQQNSDLNQDGKTTSDNNNNEDKLKNAYSENDLHPFSDSEADSKKQKDSIISHHSSDYKSDSEIEISKGEKAQSKDNISWDWGELPKDDKNESMDKENKSMLGNVLNFMTIKEKSANNKDNDDKGIYLDELDPNDMNPEVAAKYFPKFRSSLSSMNQPNNKNFAINNINFPNATSSDDDIESGKGPSLSNSPRSVDFSNYLNNTDSIEGPVKEHLMAQDIYDLTKIYHDMSMSLCGQIEDLIANPDNTERFLQSIISFDDFSENPLQILENPNLVIRMNGNYYTLKMASAMIFSLLLFQRPLSEKTFAALKDKCIPKKANLQNSRSWRSWFRSPTTDSNQQQADGSISSSSTNNNNTGSFRNSNGQPSSPSSSSLADDNYYMNGKFEKYSSMNSIEYVSDEETYNQVVINNSARNSTGKQNDPNTAVTNRKIGKYRKILRLSSDVLKSLNLKPGSNDVMFSVTTAYQGTTACKSKIFLWQYNDEIIISDIDGTITKSDVLGHILPYIGKDWAQSGVTQLYSKIEQNGYKFLYLSARAIGQAKGTRDYLTSICQEGMCLPDGPLLLSPTSLFSALHREVIEKKPEEFKISCLKDIQSLFPKNPFYAGFGNKINDTWAYRAVGIDPSRIFTINHRGELKLDKIKPFKSSFTDLSQIVDQMFPPINKDKKYHGPDDNTNDYNSFTYWRTDIPKLEDIQPNGITNTSATIAK